MLRKHACADLLIYYRQEFQKDIKCIKDNDPTWRYAPLRRISHDQCEPMPSRLRPRDTLKRKVVKSKSMDNFSLN